MKFDGYSQVGLKFSFTIVNIPTSKLENNLIEGLGSLSF